MNITVVGGGFGGVKATLELAKNRKNHVTLISDKADFQYYPALYGTATGQSHLQSWVPLGKIFANRPNIDVIIDEMVKIDPSTKMLIGNSGRTYKYNLLILALGGITSYFGIKGIETYSYGIKSAEEIRELKQHLYKSMFEEHKMEKDYVIIGAGATGVELASAMNEYIERLRVDYRLPKKRVRINLIEASPRVLPRMSEASSKKVAKRLQQLGVHVMTNQKVEEQTADSLIVNGKTIKSHTVIWTAGVANSPFYQANAEHFVFAKNGKVVVDEHMRAFKDVHVIGDNAFTAYSGLAQTALHDAIFVARNLERKQIGKKRKLYKAKLPPVVVPVGDMWAVFEWRKIRLSGWMASLIRNAADMVGYSDILPFGQALGAWRAHKVLEDDYFPASEKPDAK
ncbi:MAG: FAD-dependent oxidoreductase [Candidatus Saccharimonadales bacterium]